MSAVLPALISAGVGLLNGAANRASQERQNFLNFAQQQSFNMQQMKWQEYMYDKNNKYNLPVNQVQRLKDAGLNPHLAFQGGVDNTATAPSSSGASQYSPNPAPTMDISSMANLALAFANVKKINAETKSIEQKTEHDKVLTDLSKKDLDNYDVKFKAELQNMESQTNVNLATYDVKRQEVINLISTNEEIQQKIELLKSQKKLTDEEINKVIQFVALLSAQVDLVKEQTKTESVKRSNIEWDTNLKQEQVRNQQLNNSLLARFGVLDKLSQLGLTNAQIRGIEGALQKLPLELRSMEKNAAIGDVVGDLWSTYQNYGFGASDLFGLGGQYLNRTYKLLKRK